MTMWASIDFMRARSFYSRYGRHPGYFLAGQGGSDDDRYQGMATGNPTAAKSQTADGHGHLCREPLKADTTKGWCLGPPHLGKPS